MPLAVTVTGIEKVNETLTKFPKALVGRAYLKALTRAAQVIEAELEPAVPVRVQVRWDDETFSEFEDKVGGALRQSLMHLVVLDSQLRGGYVDVGFGKLGFIANFVEYGHRMVTHDNAENRILRRLNLLKPKSERKRIARIRGREVGTVQAHPFMRPVADACLGPVVEVCADTIKTLVDSGSV